MQQLKPLSRQLGSENRYACDVATGPVQARYEAELDRVNAGQEGNRNCRGRRLGSKCWRDADSGNHGYLATNQVGRQGRQLIILAWGPAVFDGNVLALGIAGFVQASPEGDQTEILGLSGAKKANNRHRLLRAGRQRRRGGGAAQQHYELPPSHSITSSARPDNVSGIVSPSVLAVLRLMTSSTLTTCSTGRSAGLTPLRILPVQM